MSSSRDSESYLDTLTGEVVWLIDGWSDDHSFAEQDLAEGLVHGRLVLIEPLPAEVERVWMCAFAAALDDGWARDALCEALAGAASRRRFRDALGRFPEERLHWLEYHEAQVAVVVERWLDANEIQPTTTPRRGPRPIRPG